MITKNNYIEYIIDYFDGNLTPETTDELFSFLEKHPTAKKEFNNYGESFDFTTTITSGTSHIEIPTKTKSDEFELLCIKYIEGEIPYNEIVKHTGNNPDFLHTFKLYEKTVVKSNNITFPDKKQLLKKNNYLPLKIAAVILPFLILIPTIYKSQETIPYHYKTRKTLFTHHYQNTQQQYLTSTTPSINHNKPNRKTTHNITPKNNSRLTPPEHISTKNTPQLTSFNFDVTYISSKRKVAPSSFHKHKPALLSLKNAKFIGISLLRRQNIKLEFKDNRLSYFALNTKKFFVRIKKSKL
jgi:hypothetical protein